MRPVLSLLLPLGGTAFAPSAGRGFGAISHRRLVSPPHEASSLEAPPPTADAKAPPTADKPAVASTEGAGEWALKGDFSWRANWYPMAFTKVTDRAVPHRLELLGDPIVLWFDHVENRWAAMLDECPHRLAPLSEGRVDEAGQIECPYHGWTFESSGSAECTKVPQAPKMDDPAVLGKCGGTPLAVAEKQDLLWVWGEPNALKSLLDESSIPVCEALEDPAFAWIDVSRDMPYSADMLLENVLDSSHVPFTHHKTISKRENAVPLPLALTSKIAPQGFEGRFVKETKGKEDAPKESKEGAAAGKGGAAADKGKDASGVNGRVTERTTTFRAPTYMHHRIQTAGSDGSLDSGFETWTVAYATPTGPGRCRLLARFPFKFPQPKRGPNVPKFVMERLPDWLNHMGQLKVLDDDNIFLPLQERRVEARGGWRGKYVMPTSADAYVTAYRRWFDKTGPPPHALGAKDTHAQMLHGQVDKAALLDRKSQHTDHCKSCSGALKNAVKARKVCRAALFGCLALAPSALAAALPALAATSSIGEALQSPLSLRALLEVAAAKLTALKPALSLAAAALAVAKAQSYAKSVEQALTSGTHFYPPPRNLRLDKGAYKNLKTVEQGRKY